MGKRTIALNRCLCQQAGADCQKCREYFKMVINDLRQMNYSTFGSEEFLENQKQLLNLLETNGK